MISLAGKAALITGGSRGIGAASVKLFAQAGADVVFNYHRNRDAAEQVEQEARKHSTRVESFKADLGKMADAKKLVDFAREQNAQAVMRGIRAISDYEYELQMAHMNRRLAPELETIFLMPEAKYSFVSSRLVKQVFELGGSVDGLVPKFVIERLKQRVPKNGTGLEVPSDTPKP